MLKKFVNAAGPGLNHVNGNSRLVTPSIGLRTSMGLLAVPLLRTFFIPSVSLNVIYERETNVLKKFVKAAGPGLNHVNGNSHPVTSSIGLRTA